MSAPLEKIVVVTRKTRLVELIERFNSRGQAKFYLEHAGADFVDYEREDAAYRRSLDRLMASVELGLTVQTIDREFLPSFLFTERDVVVALGQDGLVANCAKYVGGQPIVGVNPDPERFDGVLLPFRPERVSDPLRRLLAGQAKVRSTTLAEAKLKDGQRLLAFNDLFVGARTHVSARYRIQHNGRAEPQSSSGILISTGAGSTGWLSSVLNMARGVAGLTGGSIGRFDPMPWEDPRLVFVVREPFVSRHSKAELVAGVLGAGEVLEVESRMPSNGVIFSDGVEQDFLHFDGGAIAEIRAAAEHARLVVG